jgi:hypothetical protein
VDVTGAFNGMVIPGGNVLAIHCRREDDHRFIDAALLIK